ncbi:MAG: ABC transporter ATP-binding protein [Bacillota bacterium]
MLAIKTEKLTKKYKEVTAVKELDLEIKEGSVFGLLGPNGAGKTTTLKMLMGFVAPDRGQSFILGEKVTTRRADYKNRIGFLPDVPEFYNWMTAEEFLQFSCDLLGLESEKKKDHLGKLLEMADLKGVKTKIGGFSRGMKQRLGIAQALINDPEVVFMDEPTSALDPIGRKEVLELIREFSGQTTVLLSTHILTDVERVCDTVGILNEGKLIEQKTMEQLKKEYFASTLKLDLAGARLDDFLACIKENDLIENIENHSGEIRLVVSDLARAQVELPKIIGEYDLQIKSFRTAETNLEDIFVKLVSK